MSDCVPWYRLSSLNPFSSALTDSEKNCLLAEGQAEIQSVPDNLKKYYANNPNLQQIGQTEADKEKKLLAQNLDALSVKECSGLDLQGLGLGCYNSLNEFLATLSTFAKIGVAVLVVSGVTYLYVVFIAPFVGRRR